MEESVYRWISSHVWLRRLFLVLAILGIAFAALETVKPAYAFTKRYVTYAIGLPPPFELRERYQCVFNMGTSTAWARHLISPYHSGGVRHEGHIESAADWIDVMLREHQSCVARFGFDSSIDNESILSFSSFRSRQGSDDFEEEALQNRVEDIVELVELELRKFDAYLEDEKAARYFFRLASRLDFLRRLLEGRDFDRELDPERSLYQHEIHLAEEINLYKARLENHYPYRIRATGIDTSTMESAYNTSAELYRSLEQHVSTDS